MNAREPWHKRLMAGSYHSLFSTPSPSQENMLHDQDCVRVHDDRTCHATRNIVCAELHVCMLDGNDVRIQQRAEGGKERKENTEAAPNIEPR
jgi:hypothetical protein